MTALYDRVAARCAQAEIPVTAACVAEIDRMLREERRAEAYAKLGAGHVTVPLISEERPL